MEEAGVVGGILFKLVMSYGDIIYANKVAKGDLVVVKRVEAF